MRFVVTCTLALCLFACLASLAFATGPFSMNVQGRLSDSNGDPLAKKEVALDFKIFTAQTSGDELWPKVDEIGERHIITTDLQGLWTVNIGTEYPLSPDVFSGRDRIDDSTRWLQVTANEQPLPRVRFVSGPYAMKVGSLEGAFGGNIYGNISLHSQLKVGDESGDVGKIIVTDGSATTITAEGTSGDLAILGKATVGPGHVNTGLSGFVAGADNSVAGDYATIGGGTGNSADFISATVAGGSQNDASADVATVGGGNYNIASGKWSTIGGGWKNRARGDYSVVAGGGGSAASDSNSALTEAAVISGGRGNIVTQDFGTVGGGENNGAHGLWATVGGGQNNSAGLSGSTVGGGTNNIASLEGTVSGGADNSAIGVASTIGGGNRNEITAPGHSGTIGGGVENRVLYQYGAVGGGLGNDVDGESGAIGGGDSNSVSAKWGTIAGGKDNFVTSVSTGGFVGGGRGNTASGGWTVVVGGTNNSTSLTHGTVGGGSSNQAWGSYATVPGGRDNEAAGSYTFAAGRRAKALHPGTFVWADDTDADFASTGSDQFLIRVADGVGINTNNPLAKLSITASSTADPGIYISGSARDLTWPSGQSFQFGTLNGTTFDEMVRIASGGNVGIGTTNPNYKLDVRGTIGNNTTLYHSDRRWKKDISTLRGSLDKVQHLRGVSFHWRKDEFKDMDFPEGRHIGVIAQEVEEVLPELVNTNAEGYKSVEYANLVAVLIEAVKEQQVRIDEQNERIEKLEERVTDLQREM